MFLSAFTSADSIAQRVDALPTKYRLAETSSFDSHSTLNHRALNERAFDLAETIFNNARVVQYVHDHGGAAVQVRELSDGGLESKNDCSGFISYVLDKVAPKHYDPIRRRQLERTHPQAKVFAHFFAELSTNEPRDGWVSVANYRELRRGDIIAWEKGPSTTDHAGKGNSGHVMMVCEAPLSAEPMTVASRVYRIVNVPVIDSSSVYHFPPEELPPSAGQSHRDGLGKGVIRLVVNEEDRAIGYWEGSYWGEGQKNITRPKLTDIIGFGRIVPLRAR